MARALILESDKVLALGIASALKTKGHVVDWAVEPQAAISAADKNTPDVVVMDLLLAGRSGVEFLYEFVSYPEWQTVPVVLLASVPEHEVNVHGDGFAQLNVKKYLYKPHASIAQIMDAVDYATKVTQ